MGLEMVVIRASETSTECRERGISRNSCSLVSPSRDVSLMGSCIRGAPANTLHALKLYWQWSCVTD